MITRFNSKIQSTILIGSVLMISACASFKTGEAIADKADGTTRTTIGKGTFETPPEIQQSSIKKGIGQNSTTSKAASDTPQASTATVTRINQKEPYVNIRSAPSSKSRSLAVLKGGHSLEVLETRDSWVKISWQKGDAVKQGWLKKRFVEGYK